MIEPSDEKLEGIVLTGGRVGPVTIRTAFQVPRHMFVGCRAIFTVYGR